MAKNCSIDLKIESLPKVINKAEYFMFRAVEQMNMDFFKLAQITSDPAKYRSDLEQLYKTANQLITNKAAEYEARARAEKQNGNEDVADVYMTFASNLRTLNANWNDIVANMAAYGRAFKLKTKFKLDEEGMVDLSMVSDDDDAVLKKLVFDQAANEMDPFDTIDKAVELFILSIPRSADVFDDYGFTVPVDYGSFTRGLIVDLENTTSVAEIIERLKNNLDKVPEYQSVIDKLEFKAGDNMAETKFKIAFRNSFAKATIPIYMTSVEGNLIKVFQTTVASRSKYEQIVESNFYLNGMPVVVNGEIINLAHQEDGVWTLSNDDLSKIKDFLDPKKIPASEGVAARKVAFLKAVGFQLSPKTEEIMKLPANQKFIDYISGHLINRLSVPSNNRRYGVVGKTDVITNPIASLKKDWNKDRTGQNNVINNIIDVEVKYNPVYSIERSVINPEGNRQHSSQYHNNFTVINKALSDFKTYPKLQDILDAEPSLSWLNPVTNPGIKDSLYLNSLFYFDPAADNFGERRRVKLTSSGYKYVTDGSGTPVVLNINNTGGIQLKENGFRSDAASTINLSDIDKLLQDINTFNLQGFSSVTRLSDKSTDLSIHSNYYYNPLTGDPMPRPLGVAEYKGDNGIFKSELFLTQVTNGIKNHSALKFLGEKGFYSDLDFASKNILNTWGEFESIMNRIPEVRDALNAQLKEVNSPAEASNLIDGYKAEINNAITAYFNEYSEEFANKLASAKSIVESSYLLGKGNFKTMPDLRSSINYYIANTFLIDLDNMKLFFGGSIHFKAFHKRAGKDSATGIFTFMENDLIARFNNYENQQDIGANTNLSGRLLAERLFELGQIDEDTKNMIISRQTVSKEYKSGILKDVVFNSEQATKIPANIERLYAAGYISEENYNLYKDSLKQAIQDNYSGKEADGQGKCTFDFYRIISILTNNWTADQEASYKKIVEYAHYNKLAKSTTDEQKRTEYISKRDAIGYDPAEQVYFPPKKFQYSGPMKHQVYTSVGLFDSHVPMFDKFSLQPLIPTVIENTEDEDLADRMEFEGVGYVKFKTGSKTETPLKQDDLYENYDANNPKERYIIPFDLRVESGKTKFDSEHTIFFNHLKEQVKADSEAHTEAPFGSQMRKLVLMNILSLKSSYKKEEFENLYRRYKSLVDGLIQIEKTEIYNKLGITDKAGVLAVTDMKKLVKYFEEEISKKNQDQNVRKALMLSKDSGKFLIGLDAAVQAQIIEGILISSINNRIPRYKINGSMLTQVAITGSAKKFSREASEKATKTFGNSELKSYDVFTGTNGALSITEMQVKIGFTKQWESLLKLTHPDGMPIDSLNRLNSALKDENWRKENKKSIRMISYRIPTQGRNFLDVMEVVEFLPAAFGDAIIMPTEAIIKSGSDFDYDKMFTFYPNLDKDGKYTKIPYTPEDLKRIDAGSFRATLQNEMYDVLSEIILHPSNYMELVTPSTNYHILPLVDKIYKKVYPKNVKDGKRVANDYAHTDILNRVRNVEKFMSLLKSKSDLGIAAVANTFNVLFQLSNATGNRLFFEKQNITTFFNSSDVAKNEDNLITNTFYGDIYDEDGVHKSEFFAEFISSFVDAANDDYIFAINFVTELTPVAFYMKYAGLSSRKIFAFINQPAMRTYVKNLSKYESMFVKNYLEKTATDVERQMMSYGPDEIVDNKEYQELRIKLGKLRSSARAKAMSETVKQLGFTDINMTADPRSEIGKKLKESKISFNNQFTSQNLYNNILADDKTDISKLPADKKFLQLAVLHEFLNQKKQSDSLTAAQRFLNFDTKPYVSSFDAYARNVSYVNAVNRKSNVLSPDTLRRIKKESIISPLDTGSVIIDVLEQLFPLRDSRELNMILLEDVLSERSNKKNSAIVSDDDMNKYARTYKNDLMNYILQNYLGKSTAGMEFFKETFGTDKDINEYLKELIETPLMREQFTMIKQLPFYADLVEQYPLIENIIVEPGENTKNFINFKLLQNINNSVEKDGVIAQFEDLVNLEDPDLKIVKDFFRNLALYSIFQSGYNTAQNSFTGTTPVNIVNKLYEYSQDEFMKLENDEKELEYQNFSFKFKANNPAFFNNRDTSSTPTGESPKRGKWYAEDMGIDLKRIKEEVMPKAGEKTTTTNKIKMQSYNVEKIKSGEKTLTSRTYIIKNGVYQTENAEGNVIPIELSLYKAITVNDLNTPEKKEYYAKNEGFASWMDLMEKISTGQTRTLRPEFLEGNQKVYVYKIKNLSTKPTTETVDSKKVVEDMFIKAGGKKTSKGMLQVDGQHWYIDNTYWKVINKSGFDELFFYPNEDSEIAIASKKPEEKNFTTYDKIDTRSFTELMGKPQAESSTSTVDTNSKINAFREMLPWVLEMTNEEMEGMYNKEKLSGETIEEFLQRMSCLGKLK